MSGADGSSPRVWGQVLPLCTRKPHRRIIPTRVGTSHTKRIVTAARQDHPHACGDKLLLNGNGFPDTGSSPRVWGQGCSPAASIILAGIIPTRVGTSLELKEPELRYEDHPHACGDKRSVLQLKPVCPGSSPRVWGQEMRDIIKVT